MKNLFHTVLCLICFVAVATAQPSYRSGTSYTNFIDYQKTFPRPVAIIFQTSRGQTHPFLRDYSAKRCQKFWEGKF